MIALVVNLWERTNWDELIIGGAALLAAATAIHRMAIRPMVDAFHSGQKAWRWIEDELSPNSGDSLRDKVNTTEHKIDEVIALVSVIPELVRRVATLERELRHMKEHQP